MAKTAGDKDVFGRVFRLKQELRQRDLAAWNRAYTAYRPSRQSLADERQAALQAAIEAGWIESPECRVEVVTDLDGSAAEKRYYFDGTPVPDLRGSEVNYYGLLCSQRFDTEYAIPKASSST